jgi:hypothetical protein
MQRNIDRTVLPSPAFRKVRFGDLIDLHDQDMCEVGKPPSPLEGKYGSAQRHARDGELPQLNREQLIKLDRKRAKQGGDPRL